MDTAAVREFTPPLAARTLLDAGCGTGRRLPHPSADGPRMAIGVDLVLEMLAQGKGRPGIRTVVAADFQALPFGADRFDVVWCRLSIGHLAQLEPCYREFARVMRPGARLIVTDFHPAAARAGYLRSFRDSNGVLRVLEHHVHDTSDHDRSARRAGLVLERQLELRIGPEVRSFYETTGKLDRYNEQIALPLLLALCFRR
jgi:malonyl-CoA O-methyltransferase